MKLNKYYLILPFLAVGTKSSFAVANDRPNIIFILTDDQRYDLLGCTGNKLIHSPNIDKLAKDGVLFTNAHVSSAISTPSRTCILTGRFERSHGINFNSATSLSEEGWEQCYPMVLKRNGYYVGYVGKNHTPIGKGGYQSGLMDHSYDYWYAGHEHLGFYPKERHKIFKSAKSDTQVEVIQEGVDDFMDTNEYKLDGALHFLDKRPKKKPFFLNICFNLPHGAGTRTMELRDSDPEIYKSLYRDKDILLPDFYIQRSKIKSHKLPLSIHHVADRQTSYDYVNTPKTLKERIIREMQSVTGIDLLVGKLRKTLAEKGLEKNTIIIFASDHGLFHGEFGLGGKALCYEICTHIPLIMFDPTVQSGKEHRNNELILSVDIPATILDYANIKKPNYYQGFSLKPLMRNEKGKVRDYLFTENLWSTSFGNPRCESVQDKHWKYIRYYKNNNLSAHDQIRCFKQMKLPLKHLYKVNSTNLVTYRTFIDAPFKKEQPVYEELFDLEADPLESTNLINEETCIIILRNLRKECDKQVKLARGNAPLWVVPNLTDISDNK